MSMDGMDMFPENRDGPEAITIDPRLLEVPVQIENEHGNTIAAPLNDTGLTARQGDSVSTDYFNPASSQEPVTQTDEAHWRPFHLYRRNHGDANYNQPQILPQDEQVLVTAEIGVQDGCMPNDVRYYDYHREQGLYHQGRLENSEQQPQQFQRREQREPLGTLSKSQYNRGRSASPVREASNEGERATEAPQQGCTRLVYWKARPGVSGNPFNTVPGPFQLDANGGLARDSGLPVANPPSPPRSLCEYSRKPKAELEKAEKCRARCREELAARRK